MTRFTRESREQREHDRLRYPGTDVLVNKFDIRNTAQLELAERQMGTKRLQKGLPPPAKLHNTSGLKAIHKTLLRDVYDWAGQFRTYTTGRGAAPFALPEFIEPVLDDLFRRLKGENHLKGLAPEAFAQKAAGYVNDINAVHPFVDGNGRTQRVWLRNLAEDAGYLIEILPEDRDAWYKASAEGFYRSNDSMAELILSRMLRLWSHPSIPKVLLRESGC